MSESEKPLTVNNSLDLAFTDGADTSILDLGAKHSTAETEDHLVNFTPFTRCRLDLRASQGCQSNGKYAIMQVVSSWFSDVEITAMSGPLREISGFISKYNVGTQSFLIHKPD